MSGMLGRSRGKYVSLLGFERVEVASHASTLDALPAFVHSLEAPPSWPQNRFVPAGRRNQNFPNHHHRTKRSTLMLALGRSNSWELAGCHPCSLAATSSCWHARRSCDGQERTTRAHKGCCPQNVVCICIRSMPFVSAMSKFLLIILWFPFRSPFAGFAGDHRPPLKRFIREPDPARDRAWIRAPLSFNGLARTILVVDGYHLDIEGCETRKARNATWPLKRSPKISEKNRRLSDLFQTAAAKSLFTHHGIQWQGAKRFTHLARRGVPGVSSWESKIHICTGTHQVRCRSEHAPLHLIILLEGDERFLARNFMVVAFLSTPHLLLTSIKATDLRG